MAQPNGYFYLGSSYCNPTNQGFKTVTLKNDIQRGVTQLSEDAYNDNWGVTATSLRFFTLLSSLIDIRGVKAELRFSQKQHYTLIVETVSGHIIKFKGVSGGYFGEGSRGTHDILKACGFNKSQCERAFEKTAFKVFNRTNAVASGR